ncbi:TniQ family protein [Arenimonas malthae]|uniref:TniQ family protein n=1 Tax=Arenimonas malthae TaxID=354197 RepID=UPI000A00B08D
MALLAPLQLIGVGTHCVESLESYGARIAYVHSVRPARVFALARDASNAMHEGTLLRSFNYQTVCGYGEHTSRLTSGLRRLTERVDLAAGTLSPFANVLTKAHSGAFWRVRRWCPICYLRPQEDRYDLLAWQLITATHCPIDDARLVDRCRNCQAVQADFQSIGPERYDCRVCRQRLGWTPVAEPVQSSWERWSNMQTLDLIAYSSRCPSPIQGNPWHDFLSSLRQQKIVPVDRTLEVFRAFAWKSNRNRPQLRTVFQYAALQSVAPLQVLLDPFGAASATLPLMVDDVLERRQRLQELPRNQRHLRYTASVLAEAEHGLPLPSPGWLAACFGVSRPSWRAADPRGYEAYRLAQEKVWPEMPSASDQKLFSMAVDEVQSGLEDGGSLAVSDVINAISRGRPERDRYRAARAVLASLILIGIFRRLRPNERMQFRVGRIRASTKL